MKNIIYCFSGTGNSLAIADSLAQRLGETEVIIITDHTVFDHNCQSAGFVFPVYLFGVPDIVSDFLKKVPECSEKYFYSIATYKSQPGNVTGQTQALLRRGKNMLHAAFAIAMPGNNIIYYETESEEICKQKLTNARIQLDEISNIIKERKPVASKKPSHVQRFMTAFVHSVLTKGFRTADKNFYTDSNCTGCGLCEKLCPVCNIAIENGRPVFRHNCLQCVRCINACPKEAIQYGKTTVGKKRYVLNENDRHI